MADTTRYEARGCGVYIVDPSARPGDPDERYPQAVTGTDEGLTVDLVDSLPPHGQLFAIRIKDALNGNADLLAALKLFRPMFCAPNDFSIGDVWNAMEKADAAIKQAEQAGGS